MLIRIKPDSCLNESMPCSVDKHSGSAEGGGESEDVHYIQLVTKVNRLFPVSRVFSS